MASTIVFVDRTLAEKNTRTTITELARKVHDVKPHLTADSIEGEAHALNTRGLLRAAA